MGELEEKTKHLAHNVCGSKEVFQVEAPFCEHKINFYFRASQNGEGRDLKNLVERSETRAAHAAQLLPAVR